MKRHDIKKLKPKKKTYEQMLNAKGILSFKQHVKVLKLMWLVS